MEKNYNLSTDCFPSADGSSSVVYYRFVPKKSPVRAIVQISHGMLEYIMRYEPLADYLTALGYAVYGNDHTGHGKSAATERDLGLTGGADGMTDDVHTLSLIARRQFPCVPLILLGHSMGSFIARMYAEKYATDIDALVIVGTGGPDNPTALGKAIAKFFMCLLGRRHRSKLITNIAFGSYNKKIPRVNGKKPPRAAWISRDENLVERYMQDPFCNYIFTAKGYYDLFDMIGRVSRREWADQLPKSLPILMLSGDADPVGDYGRGVETIYRRLVDAHITDVRMLLYTGARHEVFNEIGREKVFADLASWLSEHNF